LLDLLHSSDAVGLPVGVGSDFCRSKR